jgi:hypothetical protein
MQVAGTDNADYTDGERDEMTVSSNGVYDFGRGLVSKGGRMMLRAAYVRDDNPHVEREVKGCAPRPAPSSYCTSGQGEVCMGADGRGIGEEGGADD